MSCLCFSPPSYVATYHYHWNNFTFARSTETVTSRGASSYSLHQPHPRPRNARIPAHNATARRQNHSETLYPDARARVPLGPVRTASQRAKKLRRAASHGTIVLTSPEQPASEEEKMPQQYQPPPYPPPDWHPQGQTPQYAPPPGPPPDYPGPSQHQAPAHVTFTSSTPSTSTTTTTTSTTAPPQDPPQTHNWQSIPDTSLLPPPPALPNDHSPTANASASQGETAFRWCLAHPLHPPVPLNPAQHTAIRAGNVDLLPPRNFSGTVTPDHRGRWMVRSKAGCPDSCMQTSLPLYAALADSPLQTGSERTLYFELRVMGIGEEVAAAAAPAKHRGLFHRNRSAAKPQTFEEAEAGVAIGFLARPFPDWRLPGWQRGSVGVHGDDGRRYVNDDFGGVDFTTAFRRGETVGLGMRFVLKEGRGGDAPPAYHGRAGGGLDVDVDVDVFFTREGERVGGWDLHEEMDERKEGGVMGLEGEMDLFGAVGVFGAVELEVVLNPGEWLWKG